MGWFVTCEICGVQGKHGLWCDCYEKETQKNLRRLKGCMIEDSFVLYDGNFQYLLQKLQPKEGPTFYMQICIQDGGGEYTCWRRAIEITEKEFLEYQEVQNVPIPPPTDDGSAEGSDTESAEGSEAESDVDFDDLTITDKLEMMVDQMHQLDDAVKQYIASQNGAIPAAAAESVKH